MIVQCTNCSTRFDVDAEMLLPSGRKLKCSNCKEVFFQKPPSTEVEEKQETETEPSLSEDADVGAGEDEVISEADQDDFSGDDDTETVLSPSLTERVNGSSSGQLPPADGVADEASEALLPSDGEEVAIDEVQIDEIDALMESLQDEALVQEGVTPEMTQEEASLKEEGSPEEVQNEEVFPQEALEEEAPEAEGSEEEPVEEEPFEEDPLEEEVFQAGSQEEKVPEVVFQEEPYEEVRKESDRVMVTESDSPSSGEEGGEEEEKRAGWALSLPAAQWGWSAALLLSLSLGAGVLVPTDWWEFKWYDLNSPFRLTQLGGEWRKHPFGTVLVVQGRLSNIDKMTQNVPKVRVAVLDKDNKELLASSVIPGRVVDDKLLDDSTEDSLRTMVGLQGDTRKVKVERFSPGQETPFQAIFIKPPESASRYRVDFDAMEKSVAGAGNARGSGGK
ncbi:MAG: zinc-ribbon domain-containing protein [Magnetococcales bacterium]|nr:zinc-ribbon domain-containing protein [Magnetococcales bacterium]